MSIDATHKQYKKFQPQWQMVNDVVNEEGLEKYLVRLNKLDTSPKNVQRNEDYIERAVFFPLTSETVKGQVGLVFSKEPEVEVPPIMEYVKTNVDGRGNSIIQQSKRVTKNVNSISRDGLYTSYPVTEGEVSKADINAGKAVATIQEICASRIINWRTEAFGSEIKLVLLVFLDPQETYDNYEVKTKEGLRELYIEDNVYKERLWTKQDNVQAGQDEWVAGEENIPTDKNGNAFDNIQFDFIGSVNNDSDVDIPNQIGMSRLNVASFRNSADYEDNVWFIGQTQSWMSGITQTHIDLMEKNNMYVGSRELIGVPAGEQLGIASAPPNPLVRQAMMDKTEMMVNIGAKQITVGGVAKTVEQTAYEKGANYSVLANIANNVSEAYTSALERVEMFMTGAVSGTIKFQLDTDFIKPDINPAELKEIIIGFMGSAIPLSDYVRKMKDVNIFDENKPDEDYYEELTVETSFNPNGGEE